MTQRARALSVVQCRYYGNCHRSRLLARSHAPADRMAGQSAPIDCLLSIASIPWKMPCNGYSVTELITGNVLVRQFDAVKCAMANMYTSCTVHFVQYCSEEICCNWNCQSDNCEATRTRRKSFALSSGRQSAKCK